MSTLIRKTHPMKLFGATLAVAAMAAVALLLVVVFATGPAQAHTPDPNLNDGKWEGPQPCGLHVDRVRPNPVPEFSEGHVALFDAYWDYNTQTLNNNLCPPLAVHTVKTDEYGDVTGIVTGRTRSNIDVNTTVFHVGDEFKATVVDSDAAGYNANDYTGQRTIDRADYPFLPPAGTVVWWLEQDDPIAEAAEQEGEGEEEPELVLGFSAGLFEEADWYAEECTLEGTCTPFEPLEYHLEAERDLDGNVLPFLVFENDAQEPKWDSRTTNTHSIRLNPGEYKHYNWVFFPGSGQSHTYVLEVHMKGHVRTQPESGVTPANWKPLTWPKGTPYDQTNTESNAYVLESINKVVTSEVVRQLYTIHVGPLTLNSPPRFLVKRSVNENPDVGDAVGDPIWAYDPDGNEATTLAYRLSGPGNSHFSVATDDDGGAQIRVAGNGDLDHEIRSSYLLALEVTDGNNRDNGADTSADDIVWVEIKVNDVTETEKATVKVLGTSTSTDSDSDTLYNVDLWASIGDLPDGATNLQVEWTVSEQGGTQQTVGPYGPSLHKSYSFDTADARSFRVYLQYDQGGNTHNFSSDWVDVTWPSGGS